MLSTRRKMLADFPSEEQTIKIFFAILLPQNTQEELEKIGHYFQVVIHFHLTGSEIALSWSPMRLKNLHWQPEFHNWLPHFSIWRLKKNFHSPVDACLKKLISDPDLSHSQPNKDSKY